MIFEQLNPGPCKTYLIASDRSREAMLVDPILTRAEDYLRLLSERGLKLRYVLDTHVHADHLSACALLKDKTGARYVMHKSATVAEADHKIAESELLQLGDVPVRVLHTPGHTADSMSVLLPDRILTGDFLFLGEGGAGRTDLLGGDSGAHWDSIQKLAGLSGELWVYPGHDYRCRDRSALAEERNKNERLRPRGRKEYVEWLSGFQLGPAPWMVDVIRANTACTRDPNAVRIPAENATCEAKPSSAPPGGIRTATPEDLAQLLRRPAGERPFVLDVRNPDEFVGELGHVEGATLIPLPELPMRLHELRGREAVPVYTICKMGGRSAKAAGILQGAGFKNVISMEGGMVRWNQCQLPVTR
jgi:glyoxylase-like metal-dependent hydrolase (beta-lactamase superfamily II)/rhodanese-related sulfurtransferase